MLSAKNLSEAIRMKRKKLRDGVELTDTAPLPKMNPQDIWNEEKRAQMEETIPGSGDGSSAPGEATMEGEQMDDSQKLSFLKARMAKIKALFDSL